jgi:hypothetical protein
MPVPPTVFELDAVVAGDGQTHPVDPPRLVGAAVLPQPGSGQPCDAQELLAVDRLQRAAVPPRAAGLDLAEDHHVGVAGDEVELAPMVAPVAFEDLHAVAAKVSGGEALPEATQLMGSDPADAHDASSPGRGRSRTCPDPKSRRGSR